MAKYSKGASKGVESAMKRMERGTLRSGRSGKKVKNPKQAIAIGLSEARKKGAKVPKKKSGAKKTASKKAAVKKSAVKRAAPKKRATARKKSATRKTAVKKSAAKKTGTTRQAAPKKTAKKTARKTAKKAATTKKTSTTKKSAPKKRSSAGRVKEPVQLRSATAEMEMPVAENDVQTEMLKMDDNGRGINQKAFDKFTSKGDPRQNLQLSSKPKGGVKPSGKKPLWN